MKLLAIDTSTDYLSLAVTNDDEVLASFHRRAAMKHSNLLVPMIGSVLKKAHLAIHDIDAFCISIGPGSFTGLRIGVATVKGLAYALKKSIVAVPTLDVIAYALSGFCGTVCPVIDAKKKKVYACLYASNGKTIKKISEYLLTAVDELEERLAKVEGDIFLLGNGVVCLKRPIGRVREDWHPRATVVAKLGREGFERKRFVKPEDLEPLYLYSRECDITGR